MTTGGAQNVPSSLDLPARRRASGRGILSLLLLGYSRATTAGQPGDPPFALMASTPTPTGSQLPLRQLSTGEDRWTGPLLLLICLAAAAPRIYLGATQYIEYDGYWHVFIAMQDRWENFAAEYRENAHPPLYYLLLKLSLWFGHSRLVYRAISILSGTLAVFLVGKIAGKFALWRPTPAIAALAYGLALPSIIISNEVRSYMLCVSFVLASFYYFLDFVDGSRSVKSRMGFAAFATLAALSHYCASFYVLSCVVMAASFGLAPSRNRSRRRLALELATFMPVIGIMALTYYTHAGGHIGVAAHLREFYFYPEGSESMAAFLGRTGQLLFNSFSPFSVNTPEQFALVLATLFFAACWLAYLVRGSLPEDSRALATELTTVLILGGIVGSALLAQYPFGGQMRQQFILFPFFVICGSILLDRITTAIRWRSLRIALTAAAVVLTIGISAARFQEFPKISTEIDTANASRFREVFPSPSSVYVDRYSLIVFFIHHHDWVWRSVGRDTVLPAFDGYTVSKGNAQFLVVRDNARWRADLEDPAFYNDLASIMRSQRLPALTTFYIRPDWEPITTSVNRIIELTSGANLCLRQLNIEGGLHAYMELAGEPCQAPAEILAH